MKKQRLSVLLALLFALPVFAAITTNNLSSTLSDLRRNLKRDCLKLSKTQDRLAENYENQHQRWSIS